MVIDYERGRDPSLEIDLSPGDFEFAPIKTKSIKLTAKSKAPRVGLLEFRLGEVDKKLQAKE